jgi:hypothetical protein
MLKVTFQVGGRGGVICGVLAPCQRLFMPRERIRLMVVTLHRGDGSTLYRDLHEMLRSAGSYFSTYGSSWNDFPAFDESSLPSPREKAPTWHRVRTQGSVNHPLPWAGLTFRADSDAGDELEAPSRVSTSTTAPHDSAPSPPVVEKAPVRREPQVRRGVVATRCRAVAYTGRCCGTR